MAINAGGTAWVLVSAALVLFMVPGLALLSGGLVRAKNVVATRVQVVASFGLVSVLWAVIGDARLGAVQHDEVGYEWPEASVAAVDFLLIHQGVAA
jgi:ammonia channel protein AmtB